MWVANACHSSSTDEALTQFVGPIARVLVRRAAANASSVELLWQALATHIDSPAERAAFLRQRSS